MHHFATKSFGVFFLVQVEPLVHVLLRLLRLFPQVVQPLHVVVIIVLSGVSFLALKKCRKVLPPYFH